jgi:hypothetical protein
MCYVYEKGIDILKEKGKERKRKKEKGKVPEKRNKK